MILLVLLQILSGVWKPQRFVILKDALTITRRVTYVAKERDGDWHVCVFPDSEYAKYLNAKNIERQHGTIVVEVVPSEQNEIHKPKKGERVSATGVYVLDKHHGGWAEIHPCHKLLIIN